MFYILFDFSLKCAYFKAQMFFSHIVMGTGDKDGKIIEQNHQFGGFKYFWFLVRKDYTLVHAMTQEVSKITGRSGWYSLKIILYLYIKKNHTIIIKINPRPYMWLQIADSSFYWGPFS